MINPDDHYFRFLEKKKAVGKVLFPADFETSPQSARLAMVYGKSAGQDTREAMAALVRHRRLMGVEVIEIPLDSVPEIFEFLKMHGSGELPFAPARQKLFPYYVILVGPLADFGFSFIDTLRLKRAVGVLPLPADMLARYVANVVEFETSNPRIALNTGAFSAAAGESDSAMERCLTGFVQPLIEELNVPLPYQSIGQGSLEHVTATIHAIPPPALIYSFGHGRGDHAGIRPPDGSVILKPLSAADWTGQPPVGNSTGYRGLMLVAFSCFSGGDEIESGIVHSQLVERFLGSEAGGLAVIGHIGLAFTYSFEWHLDQTYQSHFVSIAHALRKWKTVGAAYEASIGAWITAVGTQYSACRSQITAGWKDPEGQCAKLRSIWEDARAFVLFGDPSITIIFKLDP